MANMQQAQGQQQVPHLP
jgi:hypothetical protein